MNDTLKPLAKSLHTLTVLVKVARMIRSQAAAKGVTLSADDAVTTALCVLDLGTTNDPHGIIAKAVRAITA